MTKYFCDKCEEELTNKNKVPSYDAEKMPSIVTPGRLYKHQECNSWGMPKASSDIRSIMFEIMIGTNGVWNRGDLCKYCIIDLVKTLDDRPVIATN